MNSTRSQLYISFVLLLLLQIATVMGSLVILWQAPREAIEYSQRGNPVPIVTPEMQQIIQTIERASWSLVLLGVFALLGWVLILRHHLRQFVPPIMELHAVLQAARQGDKFRRCRSMRGDDLLCRLGRLLNQILDNHANERCNSTEPSLSGKQPSLMPSMSQQEVAQAKL